MVLLDRQKNFHGTFLTEKKPAATVFALQFVSVENASVVLHTVPEPASSGYSVTWYALPDCSPVKVLGL